MKSRPRTALVLALLATAPAAAPMQDGPAQDGPGEVAERLQQALAEAMRETEPLDVAGRVARIAPVAGATVDFGAMATAIWGPAGEALEEAQRARLGTAFRERTLARWAALFDGLEGQALETGEQRVSGDEARVEGALTTSRGRRRGVRWDLKRGGQGWRVVGLELEGAGSDPAGYARLLADEGAEALASRLEAEAQRYREAPAAVVQRLQRGLIELMKAARELGYQGRYERIAPLVEDTHDLASVVKLTLSRAWKELSAAQRREVGDTFRQLSIATYAARFDGYAGERFEGAQQSVVKSGFLVKSRLITKAGEEYQFDYMMRKVDGRWQILNIVVDGVSDLALKRQEYGEVIRKDGFEALLRKLRDQIGRYAAGEKD